MTPELLKNFKDPPAEYRPHYFWFLNHRLSLPELKRQLGLMKQGGAGGAFLHARGGRLTPYMSEEWLAQCTGVIEQSAELGLKAWLYDEDGFPSGYAGGKTLEPNPKDFAANFIVLMEEFEVKAGAKVTAKIRYEHPTSELYGVLAVPAQEVAIGYEIVGFPQHIVNLTKKVRNDLVEWKAPAKTGIDLWLVLVFVREWNLAAANVLSEAAMRVFIAETHKKYEDFLTQAKHSRYLGSVVPGIFTDEPGVMYCLGDKGWRRIIPYAPEMEPLFPARYTLSLLEHLPAVFFNLDNGNPAYRLNYWEVAGDLYQAAFFRQIHEWCEKRGLAFMGHVANEGNLFNQVRDQVDFFKGARYMHFGCSDQLGATYRAEFEKNYTLANCDNMVAPCYAASAARIFNLPRTSSECFGSAGWELSLAAQKRLVDWQVAQGINLFIPHSFNYSMMGPRKRDHPPAFNACAYFDEIHVLNDYIGRLCYLFAQPEIASPPRIAVLYGNLTILATMTPMKGNAAAATHDAQPYVIDLLQRLHFDFDIIPEDYLAGLQAGKGALTDGRNTYAIVIVASLEILRAQNAEKLLEFFNAGGTILFIQKIPRQLYGTKTGDRLFAPFLELLKISPDLLEKSWSQQALIPEVNPLLTKKSSAGGTLGFLQAPLLPIFKNHLMAPVEEFCLPSGVRAVGACNGGEIGDIVVRRREVGKSPRTTLLFIANVSDSHFSNTSIWIKGAQNGERFWNSPVLSLLNPFDGTIQRIAGGDWTYDETGNMELKWDLGPEESLVLMVTDGEIAQASPARLSISRPAAGQMGDYMDLTNWSIMPVKKNILNLEQWESKFSVEKMGIERPSYLQTRILQMFGITIEDIPEECRLIIDGDTTLVPHTLGVEINGKKVPKLNPGEILDHTMLESSNIASFLTNGRNAINVIVQGVLSSSLNPLTEPVRLYGDFTARRTDAGEWVLARWHLPLTREKTDLRELGLPHYSFAIDYDTSFEMPQADLQKWQFVLVLPKQNKPLYKVWVNSLEQGHVWFGDYTIALRDIKEGTNKLRIRYFPFPTNLYESRSTPLGIIEKVKLKTIPKN